MLSRGVGLALVLSLVACGRTEPVRGLEEPWPEEDAGSEFHGAVPAVPVMRPDAGQIVSGACQGPAQQCPQGFHCESGQCVLNGGNGQLQVTLQWQNSPRTPDDLDLHLIEPNNCEIYYGSGGLFSCQSVGSLDLDANAGCLDTAGTAGLAFDTENIIYPADRAPPSGHYVVRVDFWGECASSFEVPFVVTVRKGAELQRTTGVFRRGESDMGGLGDGRTVFEFDFP
ncbi:MAG: hypothetical protein ACOZQL_21410 [Myxococcota bacterium]